MARPKPRNPLEELILDNIRTMGWHCNSVSGDGPTYSYTVGFQSSFKQPELMTIGLAPETSYKIFLKMALAAKANRPINLESTTDKLLQGYECVFIKVLPRHYGDYVLSANWYYGNKASPLYQVVWPDLEGHFPWHPDVDEEVKILQPVLGAIVDGFH